MSNTDTTQLTERAEQYDDITAATQTYADRHDDPTVAQVLGHFHLDPDKHTATVADALEIGDAQGGGTLSRRRWGRRPMIRAKVKTWPTEWPRQDTHQAVRDERTPQKGREPLTTSSFLCHRKIACGGSVLGRTVCHQSAHQMDIRSRVGGGRQPGEQNSTLRPSLGRNNHALSFCPYSTGFPPTPRRGGTVRSPPCRGWVIYLYSMGKLGNGGL